MTKNQEGDPLKVVASLIIILPSVLLRFSVEAFRFKSKAHRAGRIFRKQLTAQGLDRSTAAQLTELYLEGSDPFKMIRSLL